jgi:hypothetical protein
VEAHQNPLRSPDEDSRRQLLIDRIGTLIGEMVIVADHNANLRATFFIARSI